MMELFCSQTLALAAALPTDSMLREEQKRLLLVQTINSLIIKGLDYNCGRWEQSGGG